MPAGSSVQGWSNCVYLSIIGWKEGISVANNLSNLCGKHIAITGRLSVPRCEAIRLLERSGAIYAPRVTRTTDVLLVEALRSENGMSHKLCRAYELLASGYPITIVVQSESLFRNETTQHAAYNAVGKFPITQWILF